MWTTWERWHVCIHTLHSPAPLTCAHLKFSAMKISTRSTICECSYKEQQTGRTFQTKFWFFIVGAVGCCCFLRIATKTFQAHDNLLPPPAFCVWVWRNLAEQKRQTKSPHISSCSTWKPITTVKGDDFWLKFCVHVRRNNKKWRIAND